MGNSTHRIEIFRISSLEKHPNADLLNIVRVFENYQAVVRISDFKIGDFACYVPPDNVLPDKPEYAFLKGKLRIKAQKLRGVVSQGLILPAPYGFKEGDDVAEFLGITHYVPGPSRTGCVGIQGLSCENPPFAGESYDLDTWFRYGSLFPEGCPVEVTEKLHGTSARYSYQKRKFWAGSRNHYRHKDRDSLYWKPMFRSAWLRRLCRDNPGHVIYGEIFGWVQDLRYSAMRPDEVWFRVFDIHNGKRFLDHHEKMALLQRAVHPTQWEVFKFWFKRTLLDDPTPFEAVCREDMHVPVLYVGAYSEEVIRGYIDGPSYIPFSGHMREGIVIKPLRELWEARVGRLALKAVSPEYLERA